MLRLKLLITGILFIYCNCYGQLNEGNQATGWKLSKDKDDIKVYTRQVEGKKFKEFRAVITINASRESLINTINDVENKPNWMTNLASAKLIKQLNENEYIYYYISDLPWPLRSRDLVMHFKMEPDSSLNSVTIFYKAVPDYIPEEPGRIRVKYANGYWNLTSICKNKTVIEYLVSGDSKVHLPTWAINRFMIESPYKTLFKLRKFMDHDLK